MFYPTIEEVEEASHIQLAKWHRFLRSPGWDWTNGSRALFEAKLTEESAIQKRIQERLTDFGGMSPAISKYIGWE